MPEAVSRRCLRECALSEEEYIAVGNPDNDGEERLAGLESKIS